MGRTRLIAIGAVSIDTILTVPYYPEEDSKLRAKQSIRRRGGNSPNSLEVLSQLVRLDGRNNLGLSLIAPLPARDSRDSEFIRKSFETSSDGQERVEVSLDHCLYREDYNESISSYIIASEQTNTRTIVNHSPLPEMTFEEFVPVADAIISSRESQLEGVRLWFHFEGRIPETTLECLRFLRSHPDLGSDRLKISTELEKPRREGLQQLAFEADVVFYSRSWAEGEGYSNAGVCLQEQASIITTWPESLASESVGDGLLVCTWGSSGASAVRINRGSAGRPSPHQAPCVEHSEAHISQERPIVDTTGAGDTFIAGMLFGLICKGAFAEDAEAWSIKQMLDCANRLAGRKILRYGFGVEPTSFQGT